MARAYAKANLDLWADEDWLALTIRAQRLYTLLLSQPDLSLCGVIPLRPRRWVLAADDTVENVTMGLEELSTARFIVIDEAAGELLIRSFIRNDGTYKSSKSLKGAQSALRQITGGVIKAALAADLLRIDASTVQSPDEVRSILAEMVTALNADGASDGASDGAFPPAPKPPTTTPPPLRAAGGNDDVEAIRQAREQSGFPFANWTPERISICLTEVIAATPGVTEADRQIAVAEFVKFAQTNKDAKFPALFKSYTNELRGRVKLHRDNEQRRREAAEQRKRAEAERAAATDPTGIPAWEEMKRRFGGAAKAETKTAAA